MADDIGAFTTATTVEPEIGTTHLRFFSFHPREEPKALGCLDATTTLDASVEPLERPTSLDVALPQHLYGRVVGEDEHGTAMVVTSPSASTPPLPQPSEAQTCVLEEEEWEIRKIVGKRRVGKGYEYKVRWRDTWLPRSELGNAQRVLQEFEARYQPGSKSWRLARADKVR